MPLWMFLGLWLLLQVGIGLVTPHFTVRQRLGVHLASAAAYLIFMAELSYMAKWLAS